MRCSTILLGMLLAKIASGSPSEASAGLSLSLLRGADLKESTVISPYSLENVLAMLNEGVTGETQAELLKVLLQGENESIVLDALSRLAKDLTCTSNDSVVMNVANRLYQSTDTKHPDNDFRKNIREKYNSDVQDVDFSNGQEAADTINKFVSDATNGMITELVTPDSVQDAIISIVNAIYFKGLWKVPFEKNWTKEKDFRGVNGNRKEPMMSHRNLKEAKFNLKHDNVEVLSLPYQDESYSFYIFLPKEGTELSELLSSLDASTLNKLIHDVHLGQIHVAMPRFKVSTSADGKAMLQSAGVKKLFEMSRDLKKISEDPRTTVSGIKHKAIIEVSEEGTEAAAASAIMVAPMSAAVPNVVPEFTADRPFLFAIVKDHHILFIGQYI